MRAPSHRAQVEPHQATCAPSANAAPVTPDQSAVRRMLARGSARRRRISRPLARPDGTRHRNVGMQQRAPPDDVVGVPAHSRCSRSIRELRQFRIKLFSRTELNTRSVPERPSRGAGQDLQSMPLRGGIRNPSGRRECERCATRCRQQREVLRQLNQDSLIDCQRVQLVDRPEPTARKDASVVPGWWWRMAFSHCSTRRTRTSCEQQEALPPALHLSESQQCQPLGQQHWRHAARHRVLVMERHSVHFGERRRDRAAERTVRGERLGHRDLRRGRRRPDANPAHGDGGRYVRRQGRAAPARLPSERASRLLPGRERQDRAGDDKTDGSRDAHATPPSGLPLDPQMPRAERADSWQAQSR
jgi:hypothetical protein